MRVDVVNRDGTLSPVPSGWLVWIETMSASSNYFLYLPDSTQVGDRIITPSSEVKIYVKPQAYPPASTMIELAAMVVKDDGTILPTVRAMEAADTSRRSNLQFKYLFEERSKKFSTKNTGTPQVFSGSLGIEPCNGIYVFDTLVVKKKTALDHFLVRTSRDTIAHNDACVFLVVAQSADNQEVPLDSAKTLTFTVDSSQYGSYLTYDSVRMDTATIDVPYGIARQAEFQYQSDGIDPTLIGPKTIKFQVCLKNDQSKKGSTSLTIKGKALMTLKASKSELKPLGDSHNKKANPDCTSKPDTCHRVVDFSKVDTCALTLSVKDQHGKGIADYPFFLQTMVRNNSGGHDHTADRPIGKLVRANEGTQDTADSFRGKTDTTGTFKFTYLCSGFGGYDSIYAEGLTKKDTATLTVLVRMAKFDSLESGQHYDLIGRTTTHVKNHFGRTTTISRLMALADSAYADSSWTLQYNDISLANGGPFDHTANLNTPHQSHREGKHTDMRPTSKTGKNISIQWLSNFLKINKYGRVIEEDKGNPNYHYHLTFP